MVAFVRFIPAFSGSALYALHVVCVYSVILSSSAFLAVIDFVLYSSACAPCFVSVFKLPILMD